MILSRAFWRRVYRINDGCAAKSVRIMYVNDDILEEYDAEVPASFEYSSTWRRNAGSGDDRLHLV